MPSGRWIRVTLMSAMSAMMLAAAPAIVHATLVGPPLTATTMSSSAIQLTWSDPNKSGQTGYSIERSLSYASGYVQIATLNKGVVSYQDNGLASGTTYYYRMRVLGRRGTASPYSNIASA